MSIVEDQIRRLDALLDKYQLVAADTRGQVNGDAGEDEAVLVASPQDGVRAAKLKNLVRALSTTSNSRPLLRASRLREYIAQIKSETSIATVNTDEQELEWLATSKATIQLYGLVLNALLDQTIPLSDSIYYWDDVLGSYAYTGLYTLQTAPFRFLHQAKEIYGDAESRYQSNVTLREQAQQTAEQTTQTLSEGWKEFYSLVQDSIQQRSLAQARSRVLSPFSLCRIEAQKKQNQVKRLREQNATAIGLLVDEGLTFAEDESSLQDYGWRSTVTRSVSLLEGLLNHARSMKDTVTEFEDNVIDSVDQDSDDDAPQIVTRLLHILDKHLPQQEQESKVMTREFGKPSRLVRYWMPGLVLFLSGGTLLRVLANRREDLINWVQELGQTTIDFWYNWVVEPAKKLIGTIRHDANSELAIMSKDSLRADRESLERMVIDFAVQHPENGTVYTESQIADLRTRVKQGDLTAVLRAYERDIQSPVKGAILGNLAQALLIQIQKTKVDVEVAMNGIDEILKSQELLFGFVGVAPGMVITFLVLRWLRSTLGNRRGIAQMQTQGEALRLLRNIDRTLSNCVPTENGMLSYKDHGLLLCEVHVLRQRAASLIPGKLQREFLEDIQDLLDVRHVDLKTKILQRIQWAYGKWLK